MNRAHRPLLRSPHTADFGLPIGRPQHTQMSIVLGEFKGNVGRDVTAPLMHDPDGVAQRPSQRAFPLQRPTWMIQTRCCDLLSSWTPGHVCVPIGRAYE